MVINHTFRVRVTKEQISRIRRDANNKGFQNVSSYLRDLALKHNDLIESKIIETNNTVKKILEVLEDERGRTIQYSRMDEEVR
ncbi:hypothetical protein HN652_03865 [archaeon]|nr:hypothetical protein [archaeon]MBT7149199.1 hypothetical protein [Candidatus Woesearchaeota archaeon]MBT7381178.1 hypothetical protein [archaeon]MBT7508126.1 hypothetical protein [archaeon]